ncbi:hypothetical protein DM860_009143 [Cuscuta australis]|uniref:Uncharacterized protein n=1 Tax=Cuscuta australis TaxID=267555 RepID=A0A328DAY3_9ASTE|nr:hypothetical protein DM860_009143 [Cuscuta australis]
MAKESGDLQRPEDDLPACPALKSEKTILASMVVSWLLLRFLSYSLMKIKCEKRGLGRTYESKYLGLRKMISYQDLFYAMLVNTIQLFSLLSLLFQFSKLYVWTWFAQFVHC